MERDTRTRLTPRQRTCIAMVAAHVSPKQIARELGIKENTVRGYLAEVIEGYGASDLRDAARMFLASEDATPQYLGEQNLRVADSADQVAGLPSEEHGPATPASGRQTGGSFHFLRRERRGNDLTTQQRLLWIVIGSVTALVLFATSAFALGSLVKLAAAFRG
jgi:hypothetical protein